MLRFANHSDGYFNMNTHISHWSILHRPWPVRHRYVNVIDYTENHTQRSLLREYDYFKTPKKWTIRKKMNSLQEVYTKKAFQEFTVALWWALLEKHRTSMQIVRILRLAKFTNIYEYKNCQRMLSFIILNILRKYILCLKQRSSLITKVPVQYNVTDYTNSVYVSVRQTDTVVKPKSLRYCLTSQLIFKF